MILLVIIFSLLKTSYGTRSRNRGLNALECRTSLAEALEWWARRREVRVRGSPCLSPAIMWVGGPNRRLASHARTVFSRTMRRDHVQPAVHRESTSVMRRFRSHSVVVPGKLGNLSPTLSARACGSYGTKGFDEKHLMARGARDYPWRQFQRLEAFLRTGQVCPPAVAVGDEGAEEGGVGGCGYGCGCGYDPSCWPQCVFGGEISSASSLGLFRSRRRERIPSCVFSTSSS